MSAAKAWPSAVLRDGVELEQLLGHVLHGLLHARLGLLPLLRAQPVEHRLHAFRRAILLHQVEARERNVQPRALGVLQHHELGGAAVFLRNLLQPLVLADAVLDVHDVIADREIAKVGEKGRDLRLLPLRMRQRNLRLVEQIARAEEHQVCLGQRDAFGHVGLDDGGRRNVFVEVGGLVDVDFAARLGRAAADAERQVVFVEDVGQPLDFAGAGDGEDNALAFAREPADFLGHGGNRAVKARRGLRLQDQMLALVRALDAELLDGDGRCLLQARAPLFWSEVKIFRANQIADQAALVRVGDLGPPGILRLFESVWLVEQNSRAGQ